MALIGESGSGKTTFGKLIAGLEKPTDGKFWFQGQEMQDLSEKQFRPYRKNLQMVFQSSSGVFDPGYTIGENILEILKLHEKLQEGEYEERVKEALIQTGWIRIFATVMLDRFQEVSVRELILREH